MNYYNCSLYGLTVSVPFQCAILPVASDNAIPDITVIEGFVPRNLHEPKAVGENWEALPGRYLLRGGNYAGRFLVEDGQRITLHRNQAAEDRRLCAFFTTSVIVAMLRQRGQLVLHANVVMTPHGAVAIAGISGAGKSTTQAALMARGGRMVAEDVTVLYAGGDGQVMVLPGIPSMNLCEDAAIKLGHDVDTLMRNPLRRTKVLVPVDYGAVVTESIPLKKLYLLHPYSGNRVKISLLTGTEKFSVLQECIYGPLFPEEHPGIFSVIRALVGQVEMIRIERPAKSCSINEVADAVLHG